jgi:hypothetical protein
VAPRGSRLDLTWWWTIAETGSFTLQSVRPDRPFRTVTAQVRSPECGARDVTVTLASGEATASTTVAARPRTSTPVTLTLPAGVNDATLTITAPGDGCTVADFAYPQYAQVIDLQAS